jgi:hypothetical protein
MMNKTIDQLRFEFETLARRSLSLPVAGMIVWLAIGIAGLIVAPRTATLVLLGGTGAIFPLGILIAKMRGEQLCARANPLGRLMGLCVLMVNLLWAVHVALLLKQPELLPLSVGIGLGLHWIVYSWIVAHPVGIIHAVARAALVTAAWFAAPNNRVSAVAVAVVATYAVSIFQMATRTINSAGADSPAETPLEIAALTKTA